MRLTEQDIEKKIKPWLRVLDTGNTYAASTMISLASLFDKAKPGDQVLAVSYGSGAYSNATWFEVQDGIEEKRGRTPTVMDYVERKSEIRNRYLPRLDPRTTIKNQEKIGDSAHGRRN